jgi:hypothetical protein
MQHTGENQYYLIVAALDVLRHRLIGGAEGGASAMTGCLQGTNTRLERECHAPIFRIWCGARQLNLVIKRAFHGLCSDRFLNMLTGVTSHTIRQQNLQHEIKATCPTFVPTRWISMGKVL